MMHNMHNNHLNAVNSAFRIYISQVQRVVHFKRETPQLFANELKINIFRDPVIITVYYILLYHIIILIADPSGSRLLWGTENRKEEYTSVLSCKSRACAARLIR